METSNELHYASGHPMMRAGTFCTDMADPRYLPRYPPIDKALCICNYCKTKYFISSSGEYRCPHCSAPAGSGKY